MVLESPFEIRRSLYVIKGRQRQIPSFGPVIAATAEGPGSVDTLTDGSGLADADADRLIEHSSVENTMWKEKTENLSEGIIFDLMGTHTVESVAIWNFNLPSCTDYGVASATLSAWTQNGGWRTLVADASFEEAEGTDDYDIPTIIRFKPVKAEKIRFDKMTPFYTKVGYMGLSEVRFYGPLGPKACNPEPADKYEIAPRDPQTLRWTAGKDALVHDVYLGQDEASLKLLGRVKGDPLVKIGGLSPGNEYVWRIDEVAKDGSVEAGPVWLFNVHGQQVAHWKLDQDAEDAVGQCAGTIQGGPMWQAGQNGQAIQLDGQDDFVEIPALNLNTNTITICAWVNADAGIAQIPGIVLCRSGQTVAGINLDGNTLRYHWNDLRETWGWDSGLVIPENRWAFVALTVQPERGTLYLYDEGTLQSAQNTIFHGIEEFDGPLCIGRDSGFNDRYFKGLVDDVKIFDFALNQSQIEQVRQGQPVDMSGERDIRLVDADLVTEDQSLEEIAAEAAREEKKDQGRNLIPVFAIVGIAVIVAGVSVFRKKK